MKSEAFRQHNREVREVMSTPVITVPSNAPVKLVAELMLTRGVSAVPVVDSDERVIGIISEADLLLKEMAAPTRVMPSVLESSTERTARRKREARTAVDLMTREVVTVRPHNTLAEAAKLMHEKRIKRLPVLEGASLVGIVSRCDLLRVFLVPDAQLKRSVERAIQAWLGRDGQGLRVAVDEGVVTLSGRAATTGEADLVARLVAGLDGVLSVESQLQ